MTPNQYKPTKKLSARKSICQFSESLDAKHKTADRGLGAANTKRESIRTGNILWSNISNQRSHTKTNQKVKEYFYNFIIHHPQVVKYQILNYCLNISICGNFKKSIPKQSMQVYIQDLHNSMVRPAE